MELQGKIAIVTGAAGGIGSAVARSLAASGATVCVADFADTAAVLSEVKASGSDGFEYALDVRNPASIRGMVEATCQRYGGLDILVTAAGVAGVGTAAALDEAEWDRIIDINLKGVFLCCQAAIAPMRERKGGRIINIGSILGKNGGNARPWRDPEEQQRSGNIAYGCSKAGVHAMTLYLARELASSAITVNAVAPGPIASAMTTHFPDVLRQLIPLQRMGTADEVAAAVQFLAGPKASFITGEILDVNGGMWAD